MERSYWSKVLEVRLGRRRALAATAAGAAGVSLIAACGGGSNDGKESTSGLTTKVEDTSKQAKRGGVHKSFNRQDIAHMDPMLSNNPFSDIKDNIYSQMLLDKPGYLGPPELKEFEHILAQSYEWSPDLLQLTLKLRPGVKWHNMPPVNGRSVDIQDVMSSWERFIKTGTQRSAYYNLLNPEAPILSYTAADANTIVVKLARPTSYLLSLFAHTGSGHFITLPREAGEGTLDLRNTAIGNGAFMLTRYEPSVGYTLSRNPDHWQKDWPYVDQVDHPFVLEYTVGLSQFKAGNIYYYSQLQAQDVLPTKRDIPAINVYEKSLSVTITPRGTVFGFLPGSPFHDERVRQALSMSYDRDLYLEAFGNISQFAADGLPVESRWYSSLGAGSIWWLDPKSSDFGPNAKYYRHDVAEAKKLLAAAGHPNGVAAVSHWPAIVGERQTEVLDNMAAEAGFRITREFIDSNIGYPKYRDGQGQYEGWAHIIGSGLAIDPVALFILRYTKAGGSGFLGFDSTGKGDSSGDSKVEDMVKSANLERDTEKKRSIVHEIQRYLAKAQYMIPSPGEFSGFDMAWPCLRNFGVWNGRQWWPLATTWIDDTQEPVKKKA